MAEHKTNRALTGVTGLDEILDGGVPKERITLLHGGPGTGKTTLGFHFLMEGVRAGDRVLYVTLLQSRTEISEILAAHGWSLEGIELLELPEHIQQATAEEQTLFSTADVELHEVTDTIITAIESYRPERMVLDSVSELSVLVDSSYQLRRHLLKLKRCLARLGCTTFFITGDSAQEDLSPVQTLVHGVIALEMLSPEYGNPRRRLEVTKMRGMEYQGGYHDFRIRTGGLEVYPRLRVPQEHEHVSWSLVASGNRELDALLGGGLEEGTACLITGTTGSGKSTLSSLYVQAAAARGEKSVIFCFDERRDTFIRRSETLGLSITRHIEAGLVELRQVDVGVITAGRFMHEVRQTVESESVKIVVIDSLTGYLTAMPGEDMLMAQLHELVSYLSGKGILSLLVVATHGLFPHMSVDINPSYLSDTIVLLRHFEARGAMHRCISVVKKRHGKHESSIREVQISAGGIVLGPPLKEFSGVLTGTPRFEGTTDNLLPEHDLRTAAREQ